MLWRVVFGVNGKAAMNFSAGPWHPDKQHIQGWANWLRAMGQEARVQSSAESGARLAGGPGDSSDAQLDGA